MRSTTSLVGVAVTLAALTLAATTALATSGTFQGYSYTTFGAATVTQFGSDSIRVSGIGPSGNDGVSIAVPTSTVGDLTIKKQMPTPAVGAYMVSTVTGTVNGVGGQTIAVRREVRTSDPSFPFQIRDDLSAIGADHARFRMYSGRNFIVDHTTAAGDTASLFSFCSAPSTSLTIYISLSPPYIKIEPDFGFGGGGSTYLGASYLASTVRVTDVLTTPLSSGSLANVSNVSGVSLRASNIPTFTITSLSVQAQPVDVPSATLPAIAFGGVALLVAGLVALRRGSVLA